MPHNRRPTLVALLLAVGVAVTGCAANETRAYDRQLRPLVGRANTTYFVDKYGEPVSTRRIDSRTEVWEFSVYDRTAGDRASGGNLTISTVLSVTFKDGVLSSWKATDIVR